jgi:hypothetical protein
MSGSNTSKAGPTALSVREVCRVVVPRPSVSLSRIQAIPLGDQPPASWLPKPGGNIEPVRAARLDCQIGSWLSMGPLASGVPMGASHGIGYVLGAVFDVPHGHTSCIMLPAVMRWNKSVNAERQALVAGAMGYPGEDAGEVLDSFIAGLGMPRSLGAVKVGPESFARLAERAMDTPGCRATRGRSPAPPRFEGSLNWPPKRNALAGPAENLQWTGRRFLAAGWLICVLIGAN